LRAWLRSNTGAGVRERGLSGKNRAPDRWLVHQAEPLRTIALTTSPVSRAACLDGSGYAVNDLTHAECSHRPDKAHMSRIGLRSGLAWRFSSLKRFYRPLKFHPLVGILRNVGSEHLSGSIARVGFHSILSARRNCALSLVYCSRNIPRCQAPIEVIVPEARRMLSYRFINDPSRRSRAGDVKDIPNCRFASAPGGYSLDARRDTMQRSRRLTLN